MSKLTAAAVKVIFMDCLFKEGEDTAGYILAEGIMNKFGFHPQRLASHREEIKELLACLEDAFHEDKGGGMSFLNACMTRDGEQWGDHPAMEQLMTLGIASGYATYNLPRPVWDALPGGVPYFSVKVK